LECAADVAQALRDLHQSGRKHGQVDAAHIRLTAHGYHLCPPEGPPVSEDGGSDLRALGAFLFEALTGIRPAPERPLSAPPVHGPRSSPAALHANALRIAVRCLGSAPEGPRDLSRTASELRLLYMLARQAERAAKASRKDRRGEMAVVPPPLAIPPARLQSIPQPEKPASERIEPAVSAGFLKAEEDRAPAPAPSLPIDPDLPAYRRCPGCHSANVYPSKPRTKVEKLAALGLTIPLYRCHECYHRWFLVFRFPVPCKVQKVQRRSF